MEAVYLSLFPRHAIEESLQIRDPSRRLDHKYRLRGTVCLHSAVNLEHRLAAS
jgi:hypothetical protein